ncbi:hypothetical protein JCM10212_007141 [Sporobolomyces blumeae]
MPTRRLATQSGTPLDWFRPVDRSPRVFVRSSSSRSPSSNVWIQRQRNDPFVRKRQSTLDPNTSFVSRSAFKLLELHDSHSPPANGPKLLRPGMAIVDLGAAPGGWIQAAQHVLEGRGTVVGVDLLPLQRGIGHLDGVRFVRGDFLDPRVQGKVRQAIADATGKRTSHVDLVLSDMMANTTGSSIRDADLSLTLCESALAFALESLSPSSGQQRPDAATSATTPSLPIQFVTKHFASHYTTEFQARLRRYFNLVKWVKPESSRKQSKEGFFVCSGLKARSEWPQEERKPAGNEAEPGDDDLYF